MTVHKSQGMTLDRQDDLGHICVVRVRCASRVKSLDGLFLAD
jgi:hypothetical protein